MFLLVRIDIFLRKKGMILIIHEVFSVTEATTKHQKNTE